jgi:hypothetical protein
MLKSRSVIVILLAIMLFLSASGYAALGSGSDTGSQITSAPAATLRAASGATIRFKTHNGRTIDDVPPQTLDLPHLVLYRNSALTDPDERTLIVEVTGIKVPPAGVTVTLEVKTQHGDPDLGGGPSNRIPVWREARWITNTLGTTQMDVTAVFTQEFDETVISGTGTIATPTDYFRYDISVTDVDHPLTDPLHASGEDYAFLMENQWIVPLPEVPEESAGAAPDELIVYYCDMFPFQKSIHDPTTWLPREDVPGYVRTELVPAMIEAFRVQTDEWGFPWYDAWTSYRPGADPERLSAALADGRTWFHGRAPSRGHSGISVKVKGGENAHYDTLADGIMSTFHHELFHSLQRNIDQHYGGNGDVDGEEDAWEFFSEGTAVLASSVGQPAVQFAQISGPRAYTSSANNFVAGGGLLGGKLNTSYERMSPYRAAIYWRFLYEQCGGMKDGLEDPGAGMQVISRALEILYSEDVVDISSSTNLVGALPEIMDRALEGSSCPFQTHAESLAAFARAIYALRVDGGRCTESGTPAGCGFYDPYGLYHDPPLSTITYTGADQRYSDAIRSSFGMDFVDVIWDPAADGQPVTLEFHGAQGADAEFNVQIWQLMDPEVGTRPRRIGAAAIPSVVPGRVNPDGRLVHTISAIDTAATNRLGLVITRIDARETSDPVGAYTVVLHPATTTP